MQRFLKSLARAFPLIATASAVFVASGVLDARVTGIVITSKTSPVFNGQSFGPAGAYESLRGVATGEINPSRRPSSFS